MKTLGVIALLTCLLTSCGYHHRYAHREEIRRTQEEFRRAGWEAREDLRRAHRDVQRELRQAREEFRREMRQAHRDFHNEFDRW